MHTSKRGRAPATERGFFFGARQAGLLWGLFVLLGPPLWAQGAGNAELFTVRAVRVEKGPKIDGFLEEPVWGSAEAVGGFIQQEPREGSPASEKTEVLLVYDSRHLYVGLRAFDSRPDGIVATEMRRDSDRILDEDNFQIIIDTFNDNRSGYMFVMNPLGARLDQQIFEEGEGFGRGISSNVNRDWDGLWEVAVKRGKEGWTAEVIIPTTTLRFPDGESQSWGINFMRNIRRNNEQVFWAPIPKGYELTRVSLAGTLTGLKNLSRGMDLRVAPYLLGGVRRHGIDAERETSVPSDVGLDLTYGVTSSLNLDVTVNTDFAQVEVDEQQVNLTRFSLFFPEKRDFFLENSGQFNMGTRRQEAQLFFSRRIGLSDSGQPIPILGGVRLTGRMNRNNIALMNIRTREGQGQNGNNFMVARYSREILARSKVGGLLIDKQELDGSAFNRTMALDTTLALSRNLTVNGFVAKTSSPGVVDGDMAFHARADFRNASWNLNAQYLDLQDNFNAEVGFVPRRGIRTSQVHIENNPRPERFNVRVLEPMVNITYTTDQNNRLLSRKVHHMVGIRLQDSSYLSLIYNRYLENLQDPFRVAAGVSIPPGTYRFGEWRFQFNTDPSRRIYEQFTYAPQTFFGGFRKDVDATVGVRVSSQLSTEVRYRRNDVELPWGDFVVDLGTLRLDYSFSPRMTLRGLFQHNSTTRELSSSVRFRYIYRPGSDLYIVYDELRGDVTGTDWVKDRQIVFKINYMLSR